MTDEPPAWRPDREQAPLLVAALAAAAGAGQLARMVQAPSDRHAVLLAALAAATGAIAWWLTRRAEVALAATLTAGLWAVPHATYRWDLVWAVVLAAACLVPAGWMARGRAIERGLLAGALAAGVVFLVGGGTAALGLAGLVGFAAAWVLPEQPAQGTIRALRSAALFAPGLVLVALVPLNAATGWFTAATPFEALWLAIGVAAAVALYAMAALGLTTLLESQAPAQRPLGVAAAASLAVLVGGIATRDLVVLGNAAAATMVPVAVLAAIAAGRVSNEHPRIGRAAFALPALLAVLQFGFV